MIWIKLSLGGFGRRGLQAIVAAAILIVAAGIVAGALMVIEGASAALARAERNDRPHIVQVKSRFNRAVFETPRSGHLPPLTLPVYEPLIEPGKLAAAADNTGVLPRQSLLRNVVSGAGFLNVYVFGVDPTLEPSVSAFSLTRGHWLGKDENGTAVIDLASARALGVDVGDSFPVRKADGEDLRLTVAGILDAVKLHAAPPSTVPAPALIPNANFVSSGVFVSLRTSEEIFGRDTLTDALVVAQTTSDVPSLVARLQEAFRLEPGVFIVEHYRGFQRKVRDFTLALAFFGTVSLATAILAGTLVANLLHEIYWERRHQYATLSALGFSPLRRAIPAVGFAFAILLSGTLLGSLIAVVFGPHRFAMPALMADLGTIEPRFNARVATAVILMGLLSVVLGMAPTAWRLARRPLAAVIQAGG